MAPPLALSSFPAAVVAVGIGTEGRALPGGWVT